MKTSGFTTIIFSLLAIGNLFIQTLATTEQEQNLIGHKKEAGYGDAERMLPKRIYVGNLPFRRRRLGTPWVDIGLLDADDCDHGSNRRLANPWVTLQGGELEDCKVWCDFSVECENIVWADGLIDVDCDDGDRVYCPENNNNGKCKCEKE